LNILDFPDDLNGDVLRRMVEGGDKLTVPRDVDFTVVFPDQDAAEGFASHFRELGYRVSVEKTGTAEGLAWDVSVVRQMVPSHAGITNFEDLLQSVADDFNGRNDGWICPHVLSA